MKLDGDKLLAEMNREINDGHSLAGKLQRDGDDFLANLQHARVRELIKRRDKIERGDFTID